MKTNGLTYRVANEITKLILEGGMRPGDKLPPMAEVEARFQVSHTVVREALRILETRGLVQIQHGKGAIVSHSPSEALGASLSTMLRLHEGTLLDLLQLRTILETEVASLASAHRDEQDLRNMEACLMDLQASPESPKGYVDADVAFHNALVAGTHNPVLMLVINSLQWLLFESREVTYRGTRESVVRTLRAHRRIFEMVKAQDVSGARTAMLQHLQETQADIEIAIQEGRIAKQL